MTRVCLIVDHPLRDLEGLVLLGAELARRGAEVFLVPMYEHQEVVLLRPDLAVVNYVRFANVGMLEGWRDLGIRIAVLDTEGGVQKDVVAYAEQAAAYLGPVSVYCVWGRRQLEALAPHAQRAGVRVLATGCPRYDYAVEPWIRAVRDVDVPGAYVLINANFPLVNPRFQTTDRERDQLINEMRRDPAYVDELARQTRLAQAALVEAVRRLAMALRDLSFVFRPHPFERSGFYEEQFGDLANVRVIQAGSVFEWIRRALAVLHHNCSTAVETFLMGREPLHAEWIDAPLLAQPTSIAVSRRADSPDAVEAMLRRLAAGDSLDPDAELTETRRRVIAEYFFANDGRAAARAADAVLETAADGQPVAWSRAEYTWRVVTAGRSWRGRLQRLALSVGGDAVYRPLRRLLGRSSLDPAKHYGVTDVQEIVGRLARADVACGALAVAGARSADAAIGARMTFASVRISQVGDGRTPGGPRRKRSSPSE